MEKIWLDSALLGIPNYAISENETHEVLRRVIEFSKLCCSSNGFRVFVSDYIERDLWELNCGPGLEEIDAFLRMMNLDHVFSSLDVFKSYQTILSRAERACLDALEVRQLGYFYSDPALPAALSPANLRTLTELGMASVAATQQFSTGWNIGSALAQNGMRVHLIRAVLDEAEGSLAEEYAPLPLGVMSQIRALSRVADLISSDQAQRVWREAQCELDLCLAITCLALHLRKQSDANATVSDLLPFSIGSEFLTSLKENQCAGEGQHGMIALQKCAAIIARSNNVVINDFGRPRQIKRKLDGALAGRVHLTKGHEGLRLMLWRNNGQVEFANVGPKRELLIESGAPIYKVKAQYEGAF